MEHRAWSIGHGAWSMEHGAWSMEHGAWGMENGGGESEGLTCDMDYLLSYYHVAGIRYSIFYKYNLIRCLIKLYIS